MKWVIGLIIGFILMTGVALAQEVSLEKAAKESTIRAGEGLELYLIISNPFQQPVKITLKDKNLLGGNGLDIQCYEETIPPEENMTLAYSPIPTSQPGPYDLPPAEISYINPVSKKEMKISSNPLGIQVIDNPDYTGQAQGITSIYQCGGISMQSTSQSFSSSFSFQQGFGSQGQAPPQGGQESQSKQSPQDMNSLKNQMQEQQEQQDKMRESIEGNEEFQEARQSLQEKGFEQSSPPRFNQDPSGNTTEFSYEYSNMNGSKAEIKGSINQEGEIEYLEVVKEEPEEKTPWLKNMAYLLLIMGLLVLAIYLYNRYFHKEKEKSDPIPVMEPEAKKRIIDYRTRALELLNESEQAFRNNEKEEAYLLATQGFRTYLSNRYSPGREMSTREIIGYIQSKNAGKELEIQEFLNILDLLKFARYDMGKDEFTKLIGKAKGIIKY